MLVMLVLLMTGCTLRVTSEILAYQNYAAWAWNVLPVSALIELTAVTLFAVNKGYYDDVPVEKTLAFEAALRAYMKSKYGALMDNIEKTKDLSADDEKALTAAIEDFKKNGAY